MCSRFFAFLGPISSIYQLGQSAYDLLRSNLTLWACGFFFALQAGLASGFGGLPGTVRSFPHCQRVIRAARNPDISKLHTLTSHTSQRVTSPHTFFQKNITRVCLDCIVLSCIVLCVRVKGFCFLPYHFIPTIVQYSLVSGSYS